MPSVTGRCAASKDALPVEMLIAESFAWWVMNEGRMLGCSADEHLLEAIDSWLSRLDIIFKLDVFAELSSAGSLSSSG